MYIHVGGVYRKDLTVRQRFVEMGRVLLVNYGDQTGKLGVVIDIINENSVLVDGVHGSDEYVSSRQVIKLTWVSLTDIVVDIAREPKQTEVKAACSSLLSDWNATAWAKKIAMKKKRTSMTDFQRYKLQAAKTAKSKLFRAELAKAKK